MQSSDPTVHLLRSPETLTLAHTTSLWHARVTLYVLHYVTYMVHQKKKKKRTNRSRLAALNQHDCWLEEKRGARNRGRRWRRRMGQEERSEDLSRVEKAWRANDREKHSWGNLSWRHLVKLVLTERQSSHGKDERPPLLRSIQRGPQHTNIEACYEVYIIINHESG